MRQVQAIADDIERLERRERDLELEWKSAWDKINRAASRLAYHSRKEDSDTPPQGEPAVDNNPQGRILARRKRMGIR